MKTIITTIALSITSLIGFAQDTAEVIEVESSKQEIVKETNGTTITVNVPVQSNKGTVMFSLQTKDNFLRGGIDNLESEIIDGQATVTFKNVLPGEYAVSLFWDKNGNKKMDFQPNGMPKEMYGMSNNVMTMGPPMWKDAVFTVNDTPQVLAIRM